LSPHCTVEHAEMVRIPDDERVWHILWHDGATTYARQFSGPWPTQKQQLQARRQSPRDRQVTRGGLEDLIDHVLPDVGACREIRHRRRSRNTSRRIRQHNIFGFFKTVFHQ